MRASPSGTQLRALQSVSRSLPTTGQLRDGIAGLAPDGKDVGAALLKAALRARLLDEAPKVTLGRYEVVRRLGAGGMGVVYEGRDPKLERRVAIKVLHESGDTDAAVLRREARLLAGFAHEHSVTVFDIGTEPDTGQLWLAMELVDGVDMRRWLEARPRSRADVLETFAGCGSALAAMHREGLSHGDFKPENVLVGEGVVKVADFGLARLVGEPSTGRTLETAGSEGRRDTMSTVGGGTVGYIAPERFDGGKASPKADQFALAAAVFEALYGKLPYASDDDAKAGRRIETTERDALDSVLARALDPDPAQRFPDCDVLAAELRVVPKPRRALWLVPALGLLVGLTAWTTRPQAPTPTAAVAQQPEPEVVLEHPTVVDIAAVQALAAPIEAHIQAARWDEAAAAMPELIAVSEQVGVPELMAKSYRARGALEQRTGDYEAAIADFERARDVAWGADLDGLAMHSAISLAHLYSEQLTEHDRADQVLDLAEAALRRRGKDPNDSLELVRARGMVVLRAGDPAAALVHFERALELVEAAEAEPMHRGSVLFYVAQAARFPKPERAREAAEEALAIFSDRFGSDHPFVAGVQSVLGYVASEQGRHDDAREHHLIALRIYEATGGEAQLIVQCRQALADVARDVGDLPGAREHLEQARALLVASKTEEGLLHGLLADSEGSIEYAAQRYAQASKHFRTALRIFEATHEADHSNLIPVLVHLAESLNAEGRHAEGKPHAERALALIGDRPHDDKARAEAAAAEAK